MTTDLVSIRKGKSTQMSLSRLQDLIDARDTIAEGRAVTSTKKARVAAAKQTFDAEPAKTVAKIEDIAFDLAEDFDVTISLSSIPLTQVQVNKLSEEFIHVEKLKAQLEALETRYRTLIFAHLDETGPMVPGRPVEQVPGKVEANVPGPHYVFERRGGNRSNPDLNAEGLRKVLPEELVAQIYVTVHHEPMPAWDEEVFDEDRLNELVDQGLIDLDVVAAFLTPGAWRTPSFYKTLMDGGK